MLLLAKLLWYLFHERTLPALKVRDKRVHDAFTVSNGIVALPPSFKKVHFDSFPNFSNIIGNSGTLRIKISNDALISEILIEKGTAKFKHLSQPNLAILSFSVLEFEQRPFLISYGVPKIGGRHLPLLITRQKKVFIELEMVIRQIPGFMLCEILHKFRQVSIARHVEVTVLGPVIKKTLKHGLEREGLGKLVPNFVLWDSEAFDAERAEFGASILIRMCFDILKILRLL